MEFVFDHVAQVVPDIAEAVTWYQETFPNVQVLHQDATWGFIEVCGAKLAFVVRDQHPGHIAWRVSANDLDTLSIRYSKEIKPHRDGTRSFYLYPPGGQSVEIISIEGSAYEAMQMTEKAG